MPIVKNSIINIVSKVLEALLMIISSVSLARLISPSDFGTFAIIYATFALFSGFLDIGLSQAYIKAPNDSQELKDSFFTINLILGISTTIALIISAPIISYMYSDWSLLSLMIVFSSSAMISSLSIQGIAELTRKKEFYTLVKISLISSFVSTLLSITAAYYNFGIWTFNLAVISKSLLNTILVFHHNNENKYSLKNYQVIKKYSAEIKIGGQIFIGRILNGVINSIDKFLLASHINSNSLAQYRNSQSHALMVDTHIRMPIGSVVFAYVERYSKTKQENSFFPFVILTTAVTFMANGLLIIKGEDIYLFVFGPNWQVASTFIKYFGIFSCGMVLKGIHTTIALIENKMSYQNYVTAISIILMILTYLFYYSQDLSLIDFVRILSYVTLLYWLFILVKKLKNYGKHWSFIVYNLCILGILLFCEYIGTYFAAYNFGSLIVSIILFETLMCLLLVYIKTQYFKGSTPKV